MTPAPRPAPTPLPLPVLPPDCQHQTVTEASELYLASKNIPLGRPIMAEVKAPGTSGETVTIQTNTFRLQVDEDSTIFCFDVEITSDLPNGKTIYFTKRGNDDYVVRDKHKKCIQLFKYLMHNNDGVFKLTQDNKIIYDGQKLLFSYMDLKLSGETHSFVLDTSDMENLNGLKTVTVRLTAAYRNMIEFSRENLIQSTAGRNLRANDRSLAQFLELVLNQNSIMQTERFGVFENGKVYILQPEDEEGYEKRDYQSIGDGKQILPGLKKRVSFVEGPFGRGNNWPSIVMDAIKTVFHVPMTVYDKSMEIANLRNGETIPQSKLALCTKLMRGLDCFSNYTQRTRHLEIRNVDARNANNASFELEDGRRITVAEYFKQKYGIVLRYPHFNLVICKEGRKENAYPMELLTISDYQRVTTKQQTVASGKNSTKICTILPDERKRLIMAGSSAIQMDETNDLLNALKIRIFEPMTVQGRQLPSEKISYANSNLSADKGKWRSPAGHFMMPGKIPEEWALFGVKTGSSRFGINELAKFGEMFVRQTRVVGIAFPDVTLWGMIGYDLVERKINEAAKAGCQYILFISDDNITDLHSMFKLRERQMGIVIQDCRLRTAENITSGKHLALENIVAKVNIKLGGMNYFVQNTILKEEHLIVGIGLSNVHSDINSAPAAVRSLNPISVGYTSNAVHPQKFVGDFLLTPNGAGIFMCVERILTLVVNDYQKHRGKNPTKIIVYRSGASEGAFASILETEVPLARDAIRYLGVDDKLIYIATSKDHTHRFFKAENQNQRAGPSSGNARGGYGSAADANIPPGIVIDSQVTHPSYKMFYMNSHVTIQGSAKTPAYTVLVDDTKSSLENIEKLTYALCHHHQIVCLTTSVPSPLYIANEYAKRGRALWLEHTKQPVPSDAINEQQRLEEMNDDLGYRTSKFADTRINA